jgi:hypothetical protein
MTISFLSKSKRFHWTETLPKSLVFSMHFGDPRVTRPIFHGNVVLGWLVALLDFARREI